MIVVWFVAIGLIGLKEIVKDPAVLQGLSPTWGIRFLVDHGIAGYLVLGGVVLAVTGAEALYADRGHFGAAPIRLGWFALALPALMLNYLGQAAMILHDPSTAENPFFLMAPALGPLPAADPRDRRDDHRLAGGDLRLVLGRAPGRAARLPAAPEDPSHLEDRGADLRAGGQLGAVRSASSC